MTKEILHMLRKVLRQLETIIQNQIEVETKVVRLTRLIESKFEGDQDIASLKEKVESMDKILH